VSGFPLYGRQGKFTFRLLALVLLGQAVLLSFFALVARANAIADGRPDDGARLLALGLGLAALAVVTAGLMRRSFGITVGWLVQVLTWASAALVPVMAGVAAVFTGLWVLMLVQGRRVDRVVAEREAGGAGQASAEA
jgi:hypothetical protein